MYGECDEDGFYFGECNGRKGFVPSNMVCEASVDEVADYQRQRGGRGRANTDPVSRPLPPGQVTKPHRPHPSAQYPPQNSEVGPDYVSISSYQYSITMKPKINHV